MEQRSLVEEREGASGELDVRPALSRYQSLCERIYVETNYDFADHLENYRLIGGQGIKSGDPGNPGPKVIAFGCTLETAEGGAFRELSSVAPGERVTAWTRWIPYDEDREVRYQLRSPSGELSSLPFTVEAGDDVTTVDLDNPLPMEPGRWVLTIWAGIQGELSAGFDVASDTRVRCGSGVPRPPTR